MSMLPQSFDNAYHGQKPALWIFGLLLFLKTAMSVNSMLNGREILRTADGIPVDTYPPDAARTLVSLFALLALSRLVLCVLSVIALIRYQSMVPLLFALFLLEHAIGRLILLRMPIPRVGSPPGFAITMILLGLMIAGLALSLWKRSTTIEPVA